MECERKLDNFVPSSLSYKYCVVEIQFSSMFEFLLAESTCKLGSAAWKLLSWITINAAAQFRRCLLDCGEMSHCRRA